MHLLVELQAGQSLSSVMHQLKGATARGIRLKYAELGLDMESNSLWQKSYGARPVPPDQVETVRNYLLTQSGRPLRHE